MLYASLTFFQVDRLLEHTGDMSLHNSKPNPGDLLQGTLDLLILQTLVMGPAHGHTIAHAIEHRSEEVLQVEHGSLYPALHRLEDRGWIASFWGTSENNRKARYYRRKFWDAERARELDSYLELETEDNIARGAPPESARLAARRKLGNATLVREEIYGMNTLGFLETLWQDLRYGWRVLSKSPGLTAVALISLSLGIGATTAIFSVVYGVLISPYPYARPGEIWAPLVQNAKDPNQGRATCKASEFLRLRQVSAFASAMATLPGQRLLSGGRDGQDVLRVHVHTTAVHFLGVDPVLGRTIFPSDINAGGQAQPVVVLSYKAWQPLFNGRADALGKP